MKLKTKVISPDKIEKSVYVEITRERNNTYSASLFLEDDRGNDKKKSLGEITFEVVDKEFDLDIEPYLNIKVMWKSKKCPEYAHIGNALHEYAFRFSFEKNCNCNGRIKLEAAWASHYFHFKNKFRPDFETIWTDKYYLRILKELIESDGKIQNDLGSLNLSLPKHAIIENCKEYDIQNIPETKEDDNPHGMTRGEAILSLYEQKDFISAKILVALNKVVIEKNPLVGNALNSIIQKLLEKNLNKKYLFDTLISVLIDGKKVNQALLAILKNDFNFPDYLMKDFSETLHQSAISSDERMEKELNKLLCEAIDLMMDSTNANKIEVLRNSVKQMTMNARPQFDECFKAFQNLVDTASSFNGLDVVVVPSPSVLESKAESITYQQALRALRNTIDAMNNRINSGAIPDTEQLSNIKKCCEQTKKLVLCIEKEWQHNPNEEAFLTDCLISTNKLLVDSSADAIIAYQAFARNAQTSSSRTQKIIGGLMIAFGTAIAALGIVSLAVTLSLSAPASAGLIAGGVSLTGSGAAFWKKSKTLSDTMGEVANAKKSFK